MGRVWVGRWVGGEKILIERHTRRERERERERERKKERDRDR